MKNQYWHNKLVCCRRLSLRSASNRLLISLLAADFLLLVNGYQVVIQNLVGSPIFGVTGKISFHSAVPLE